MTNEPTLYDVLDAINALSSSNDRRFDRLEVEIATKPNMEQILAEMASKQDLTNLENRMLTHLDHFAARYQGLDLEILALRSRYGRMEEFMAKVAKRLKLESHLV